MARVQNSPTYYTDRDLTNARRPEVPLGTWDDDCFLAASNSSGIGISTGNEYNTKEQSWGRNVPDPDNIQVGAVIGGELRPQMGVKCDDPGNPLAGGCRVVLVQADQDTLPGEFLEGVSVFSVYNASGRTVKQGEWVWGEAVFTSTFEWEFSDELSLPPAIVFSRASEGTYDNADGFVRTAAVDEPRFGFDAAGTSLGWLIEETSTNVFTNSQDFIHPDWLQESAAAGLVISGITTSPSGALDATLLTRPVGGSLRSWRWQDALFVQGNDTCVSVYYKRNPTAPAATHLCLNVGDKTSTTEWAAANIKVDTGVISVDQSGTDWLVREARSVDIGNGWYRFYMIATIGLVVGDTNCGVSLKPADTYGNYGVWSWSSNVIDSVFIWGAMAQQGSFTSYVPSVNTFTSRASVGTYVDSTGLIKSSAQDLLRLSYNPTNLTAPPREVFEPAFTNECPQSVLIGQWPRSSATSVSTDPAELDPGGDPNGRYIFCLAAQTGAKYMNQPMTGLVVGGYRTASTWVKPRAGTNRIACLSIYSTTFPSEYIAMRYDPSTGTVTQNKGGNSAVLYATAQEYPNGWTRLVLTGVSGSTGDHEVGIGICTNVTSWIDRGMQSWTGDGTGYYIWGPQVNDGLGLNNLVTTGGTVLSLAEDVYTSVEGVRADDLGITSGTDFTDLWNPLEGTIVVRAQRQEATTRASRMVSVHNGVGNDIMEVFYNNQIAELAAGNVRVAGVQEAVIAGTARYLLDTGYAFAYELDNMGFSGHGSTATEDLDATVPVCDQFWYGRRPGFESYLNGFLKSIVYFNIRQPNATLERLSGSVGGTASEF